MRAVLGDDVVVAVGLVGVVELDNVGVAQTSMHFYLAFQHRQVGALEFLQVDHFYCVALFGVVDVGGLVDPAAEALAQQVLLPVLVLAHADVVAGGRADAELLLGGAGAQAGVVMTLSF